MVTALLAELLQVEYLPRDLTGRGRHSVGALSAPVFDSEGRTQMNLSLQPHRELSTHEIERTGRRLLNSCNRVTRSIGGRPPADPT